LARVERGAIAGRFHNSLADTILQRTIDRLEGDGFRVLRHRQVLSTVDDRGAKPVQTPDRTIIT